jgi:hypothetical protein
MRVMSHQMNGLIVPSRAQYGHVSSRANPIFRIHGDERVHQIALLHVTTTARSYDDVHHAVESMSFRGAFD